jgi:hypothetical protein
MCCCRRQIKNDDSSLDTNDLIGRDAAHVQRPCSLQHHQGSDHVIADLSDMHVLSQPYPQARAAVLTLTHSVVNTPVFMPVGTQGLNRSKEHA